jgi:2-polyprenyl-3-methyl-5-hydroxy-6-metoxy-1,4-benzoquinol methylase
MFWRCNFTEKDRYTKLGVTDLAEAFVKISGIKKPRIMDVGCSSGTAISGLRELLVNSGFQPYLVGLDIYENCLTKAKKSGNFNSLILGNITDDKISVSKNERFDIIICSRVGLFVKYDLRSRIVDSISRYMKYNGCMITDIDDYQNYSKIKYSKDAITSNKAEKYKFILIRGKKTVSGYARSIKKNWYALPPWKKIYIEKIRIPWYKMTAFKRRILGF